MLCKPCRVCPHGLELHAGGALEVCYRCLRALFTVETFIGPRITNLYRYVRFAHVLGVNVYLLETHCFAEEEQFSAVLSRVLERSPGTDWATAGDTSASPSERSGTSP